MIFTTISTEKTTDLSRKYDLLTFLTKILKSEITLEEAKESQKDFYKYLKTIRKGNKNQELEKTLANIKILFNGRNDAINFI